MFRRARWSDGKLARTKIILEIIVILGAMSTSCFAFYKQMYPSTSSSSEIEYKDWKIERLNDMLVKQEEEIFDLNREVRRLREYISSVLEGRINERRAADRMMLAPPTATLGISDIPKREAPASTPQPSSVPPKVSPKPIAEKFDIGWIFVKDGVALVENNRLTSDVELLKEPPGGMFMSAGERITFLPKDQIVEVLEEKIVGLANQKWIQIKVRYHK